MVAWYGEADDLLNNDDNDNYDVFHYDIKKGKIENARAPGNTDPNDDSEGVSVSGNGRVVVFTTWADNLHDVDDNSNGDVYAYDRKTGDLDLVSIAFDGGLANGESASPFGGGVSSNGRFVVFASDATNLVEGETDGRWHIFVRDRKKGVTTLVSVNSDGDPANDSSEEPTISGNGKVVAFLSEADNLHSGEEPSRLHLYVHDVKKGLTTRVSETEAGGPGNNSCREPTLNKNGKLLAFQSDATNLVSPATSGAQLFLYDVKKMTLQVLSL
ncbi:MAG: TolB family protein, partial [Planctomycetota bacterium]